MVPGLWLSTSAFTMLSITRATGSAPGVTTVDYVAVDRSARGRVPGRDSEGAVTVPARNGRRSVVEGVPDQPLAARWSPEPDHRGQVPPRPAAERYVPARPVPPRPVPAGPVAVFFDSRELAGRYGWIVALMSSFADRRLVRGVVALSTLTIGAVAVLEIFGGYRATSPTTLGLQVGAATYAVLAGVWWLWTEWPRLGQLFAYLCLSDVAITVATLSADLPVQLMVGKSAFLAITGLLAGFFLDGWMLATHLLLATGGATGIAVLAVLDGAPAVGVLVVWLPVVTLVLGVPALLYMVARSLRLDLA